MQVPMSVLVSTGFVLVFAGLCCCSPVPQGNEPMSRITRPKVFTSPDELRNYLEELGNFYAVAGRPRFGKRTLEPWMAALARQDEEDEEVPVHRTPPFSTIELLQILSSMPKENEDH